MTKQQSSSTTVTYALKSPYTDPVWPIVTPDSEAAILDALIPILCPFGKYQNEQSSQPKTKRKNRETKQAPEGIANEDCDVSQDSRQPAIAEYLTIGFNSTIRHLELLSQSRVAQEQHTTSPELANFSAIFVNVTALPEIMLQPLPLLAALASQRLDSAKAIRLVPVSQAGAARIAEALSKPRVAVCGLLIDAPGVDQLLALLAQHIPPVDVPMIGEARDGQYLPMKIQMEETGGKEKGDRKRKRKPGETN